MMKFEPVEGNGWYVFDQRIHAPPAFFVEAAINEATGCIEGFVNDNTSEFNGYKILAHTAFVEDGSWLSIRLYKPESAGSDCSEPDAVGDVRLMD